jgi:membrane fusion protein (multidrug efflux system)
MKQKVIKAFHFTKRQVKKQHASILKSSREAPPALRKGGIYLLGGALTLFILSSVYKWVSYKMEARFREEEILAGPRVRTAKVQNAPTERLINVIGEAKPFASVTLYAKVSGYLKEVKVDKGDVVKKGQVLGIIESPETDKDYMASLADSNNKQSIAKRMKALLVKSLVSQQEAEQAISDAAVAKARLDSQAVQKNYEILRAPFDGTVTSRYADPGALVQNATNSQASALPMVTVSQINRLRVYVYLDQRDAPFVEKGSPVEITAQENPNLKLQGTVARVSGELDARTRMLLTEIDLENKTNAIVAGSFVQVKLKLHTPPLLEMPVEAIVLRQDKSFAPVIKKDDTVTFREIKVLDNDGKKIRVLSGLSDGETVALNLGTSVIEGGKVRPLVEENPQGAQKK